MHTPWNLEKEENSCVQPRPRFSDSFSAWDKTLAYCESAGKGCKEIKKKRGEAEAQQVRLWWDSWVRSSDAHMQGRTQVLDNVNELRLCKLKGKDARGEARGRGAKGGENSRVTDGEQGKDA